MAGRGSYTRFGYERLSVCPARDGGLDVTFTLTNRGGRSGAEVAQVYVGPAADAPVAMPVRTLAAFGRADLRAGSSRRITLHVDERRLSYWATDEQHWVLPTGRRTVWVGASSRDIRLTGSAGLD
ncbi:fibronectin type III-like domain-contianing protein [Streptomyces tendae]|uniref:fibronectin type III-like domain-contianing protein n=1 Tax=Streptomyces tendae TaxID=1932 RepID=UPI00365A728B